MIFTVIPVNYVSASATSTVWTQFQVSSVVRHVNASYNEYGVLFDLSDLVGMVLNVQATTFASAKTSEFESTVLDASPILNSRNRQPKKVSTGTGQAVSGLSTSNCNLPSSFTLMVSFERQHQEPMMNIYKFPPSGETSWFERTRAGSTQPFMNSPFSFDTVVTPVTFIQNAAMSELIRIGATTAELVRLGIAPWIYAIPVIQNLHLVIDATTKAIENDAWNWVTGSAKGKYEDAQRSGKKDVETDAVNDGLWQAYFRTCLRRKLQVTGMEIGDTARCLEAPPTHKVREFLNCAVGKTCGASIVCGTSDESRRAYAICKIKEYGSYAEDSNTGQAYTFSDTQAGVYVMCARERTGMHWVQDVVAEAGKRGPGSCRPCSGAKLPNHFVMGVCPTTNKVDDCCAVCKSGYMHPPTKDGGVDVTVCQSPCGANR